ncbi:hypothetical protein Tco_0653193 [Tanacetum coccineum]|uniref:Uncharacterized protein n=1 Tax=Tanacetum coccineum TaxID=301880 RepID=A0ABQ4WZP3_9ASTR
MKTIHVTFDEMHQSMAPVRMSSGPEPFIMTPGQLKSGLAPTDIAAGMFFNRTEPNQVNTLQIISEMDLKLNPLDNIVEIPSLAKGRSSEEGIDFVESFALVARIEAIRNFHCKCCKPTIDHLSDGCPKLLFLMVIFKKMSLSVKPEDLTSRYLYSLVIEEAEKNAISTTEAEYIAMSGCLTRSSTPRSKTLTFKLLAPFHPRASGKIEWVELYFIEMNYQLEIFSPISYQGERFDFFFHAWHEEFALKLSTSSKRRGMSKTQCPSISFVHS